MKLAAHAQRFHLLCVKGHHGKRGGVTAREWAEVSTYMNSSGSVRIKDVSHHQGSLPAAAPSQSKEASSTMTHVSQTVYGILAILTIPVTPHCPVEKPHRVSC